MILYMPDNEDCTLESELFVIKYLGFYRVDHIASL